MQTSSLPQKPHDPAVKKRLIIADRHVFIRDMIRPVIEKKLGCEIVAETASGAEALKLCRELKPDGLILELELNELSGTEVLGLLREKGPQVRTLVFTGTDSHEQIRAALRIRPTGFVHKQASYPTFQTALQSILRGSAYFCPLSTEIAQRVDEPALGDNLNEIERVVLKLVAEGKQNKEIGDRLHRSPKTVQHDRTSVMKKLGVHDLPGLTRAAIQLGLVPAK